MSYVRPKASMSCAANLLKATSDRIMEMKDDQGYCFQAILNEDQLFDEPCEDYLSVESNSSRDEQLRAVKNLQYSVLYSWTRQLDNFVTING